YAYLKGTPFVIEGPGFSRLQSVFAASVEILSLIHRGDVNGKAPAYSGSLRPGLPGIAGEARFEVEPFDPAECPPKSQETTPTATAESGGKPKPPAPNQHDEPPADLSETAAAAWQVVRASGGKGILGKEIVAALAKQKIVITQGTLRK